MTPTRLGSARRDAMARDPVCGMTVDEKKAAATVTHEGKTYYFCASACRDTFVKNPTLYMGTKNAT